MPDPEQLQFSTSTRLTASPERGRCWRRNLPLVRISFAYLVLNSPWLFNNSHTLVKYTEVPTTLKRRITSFRVAGQHVVKASLLLSSMMGMFSFFPHESAKPAPTAAIKSES